MFEKILILKKYFSQLIFEKKRLAELRLRFDCHISDNAVINVDNINNLNIGKRAYISSYAVLTVISKNRDDSSLAIGEQTSIGEFSDIRSGGGKITIGDNCLIAPHVSIISTNHLYKKSLLIRENDWDENKNFVTIENDVWIGSHAVILPGVKIRKGAIVAAGSVVSKNVDEYTIVGGVPARPIAIRE